jgi:hypothetical protein
MASIWTDDETVFFALADDDELSAARLPAPGGRVFSGYRDASGIEHESYSAACAYYGIETPEQLAAEAEAEAAEYAAELREIFESDCESMVAAGYAAALGAPWLNPLAEYLAACESGERVPGEALALADDEIPF